MDTTIRIMLVEDHTLVRMGIRSLLESLPQVEVIGEAGSGQEALNLLPQLQPDLLLLDIAMAEMNGLEVAKRVAQLFPQVRVVMLSMYANEAYVVQALRSGAKGYLLKDASLAELELAIRIVMRNETYLSPAVSKHVASDRMRWLDQHAEPEEALTPRQREVLRLIAEGRTTREIAQTLTISAKTVETHRTLLMERLNIHDIAGLVRYAIRVGLVLPGE
ncbi:response regulator [Candidatus Viridilinea mediisalina]|uniref:DNA-binding response regulator n=1 Tax=Candidatus Viridilinea mediisalina TaxID=2024553 RepID=A0A2A6RED1_9CHLR|nr:response regulator transcription factor [Candidatus Viridilinea mediisalina]PDW00832.1 DNA-binding response regulator [Candidatus Viridilinea mediisalina]